jgi:hypothetical protein
MRALWGARWSERASELGTCAQREGGRVCGQGLAARFVSRVNVCCSLVMPAGWRGLRHVAVVYKISKLTPRDVTSIT